MKGGSILNEYARMRNQKKVIDVEEAKDVKMSRGKAYYHQWNAEISEVAEQRHDPPFRRKGLTMYFEFRMEAIRIASFTSLVSSPFNFLFHCRIIMLDEVL